MNARAVSVAVWSLGVLFALACLAFAGRSGRQPLSEAPLAGVAVDRGALWQAHCGNCHPVAEFQARLSGPQAALAARELLQKLEAHGDTSLSDDLLLVSWLSAQAEAAEPASAKPPAQAEPEDDYSL